MAAARKGASGGKSTSPSAVDRLRNVHVAIIADDTNLLERSLVSDDVANEEFSSEISEQHAGMTPLALACALNELPSVKMLLSHGAKVNGRFTELRTTALMTSSFHGHSHVVGELLSRGARVQAVDKQGSTALSYAFGGSKSSEVISQLLQAGVDVNRRNVLGMNALLLVAGYADERVVKLVLDAGADPTSANDFGHTALHLAIVGKRSLLKALAASSGDAADDIGDGLNRRDLDVALRQWVEMNSDLLTGGAGNLDQLDKVGRLMMTIGSRLDAGDSAESDQMAIKRRVEAVWKLRRDRMQEQRDLQKSGVLDNLLSCGASKRRRQRRLQHLADAVPRSRPSPAPGPRPAETDFERQVDSVVDRCSKVLRRLIDGGCRVDATEKTFGLTPLDMAVLLGDVESTALLVSVGGNPDHLMKTFASSHLYDAVVAVDRQQVKSLLRYDTDLDVNLPFGAFAAAKKSTSTLDGHHHAATSADTGGNVYRYEGLTPLTVAAQLTTVDVLDIIRLLQKHGADVNKVGSGGSSPLAEAARIGSARMVEFLVDQGADVELKNPAYGGATAVVVAVLNRRLTVVEVLIAFGAKVDQPLDDGRTALIVAMETNDREMIEMLLEANLSDNYSKTNEFMYEMAKKYRRVDQAGSDSIMKAITEKMQELVRKKEEQQQQQARDSDTLSTIVMTPVSTNPGQVSQPVRPRRSGDVERAAGRVLRRVETTPATSPTGDGTAGRPEFDRAASDGDDSDDGVKEVVSGRPGPLKRWPAAGDEGLVRAERSTAGDDDDETSDDDNDDDDQPSGNNDRREDRVPPVSWTTDSPQSTPTATPDDSRAGSSSVFQKQPQNDQVDDSYPGRTLVSRATVI